MKNFKKTKNNSGAAMLVAVIFLIFISMAIISGLVVPSVREYKIASESLNSKKSYFLAESGVEDAFYRIVTNRPISSSETLTLDSNSVTTTINSNGNQKEIISLGDVLNYERKVNLTLTVGSGISFNYGVQVGQGGVVLSGSSKINGNVYANGPIIGDGSSSITGTAISGNSPSLDAEISNFILTFWPNTLNFGNANATQDIAQSFKLSSPGAVNKVQLFVKKVGTPNNATVKIVNDVNGNPGTIIYATGTLFESQILTETYCWANAIFAANPLLDADTTYWLVVDASTSSSKYYITAVTGDQYANGLGKIGQQGGTWNNTTPSALDYYFKIYLGGYTGLIAGSSNSEWNQFNVGTENNGSAQAYTVKYTKANGDIYCKYGISNNKSCTWTADYPGYIPYPILDANIEKWENDATLGGTYSGTYNTPNYGTSKIGPKMITGDLIVDGSHTLYLTGTVYVKGNVEVSGSAKIVLDASYGNNSGIIVTDGWLNLGGSGQLNGTGQQGSYILFVTNSSCDATYCGHNAIDISGSAGSVVLNAQKGTIGFTGSAKAKEAIGHKLVLSGSTEVNYESGLANLNFSSGPTGGWEVGTWKETE